MVNLHDGRLRPLLSGARLGRRRAGIIEQPSLTATATNKGVGPKTASFVRELLATNLGAKSPGFTEDEREESRETSLRVLRLLGADGPACQTRPRIPSAFAEAVASHLAKELPVEAPDRPWTVFAGDCGRDVSGFRQYRHLPRRTPAMDEDGTGTLRAEWGIEWPLPPDVAVGLVADELDVFLHAAITCLWTIEPEALPAIKHQGTLLNRLRHGGGGTLWW